MHYLTSVSPSTLVFGALVTVFVAAQFVWPSQIPKAIEFVESRKFWLSLCAVLMGGYLLLLGLSTTYLGFSDHVEPNVTAVSSLVGRGEPLYHGLESAQRYSLVYGPMSYLPYIWSRRFLGQRVLSVKLVVMFANLGVLAFLWISYRTRLTFQQTVLATVAVIPFLLAGEPYLIEVRGDVVMILAAAMGLAGAVSSSPWRAGLLLAAGGGVRRNKNNRCSLFCSFVCAVVPATWRANYGYDIAGRYWRGVFAIYIAGSFGHKLLAVATRRNPSSTGLV